MNAIILSIGDELLIGQTINTNSAWIGQLLTTIGIKIIEANTIADSQSAITAALDEGLKKADMMLITGGLGPTSDDLTLPSLAQYFKSELVWDEKVWQNIQHIFHMRGREINESSKQLAYVPHNATVIYNTQGTAPGTIFYQNGKMVVSMPGVPYEMKAMMELDVLPFIKRHFKLPFILNRHILTAGVGETQLASKLTDFERELPEGFKLAYLPNIGKVKLRISGTNADETALKAEMDLQFAKAAEAVERYTYGFDNDTLEQVVGKLLIERSKNLCIAESCSGGYISHLITSVAGSSNYFKGAFITYSNEMKMSQLGVQYSTLEAFGAVSAETVKEMLSGSLKASQADVAIAVSGVAGPGGGSEDKPVGTVYIGIADRHQHYIRKFSFTTHRERNIQLSGVVALMLLRNFLLGRLQTEV
jgi:nicotinamide-nucleotide amidase